MEFGAEGLDCAQVMGKVGAAGQYEDRVLKWGMGRTRGIVSQLLILADQLWSDPISRHRCRARSEVVRTV